MSLLNLLCAPFAWQRIKTAGVYSYEQNRITGRRRVTRMCAGGYSPMDRGFCEQPRAEGIAQRKSHDHLPHNAARG